MDFSIELADVVLPVLVSVWLAGTCQETDILSASLAAMMLPNADAEFLDRLRLCVL